jgi:hypothetical protein
MKNLKVLISLPLICYAIFENSRDEFASISQTDVYRRSVSNNESGGLVSLFLASKVQPIFRSKSVSGMNQDLPGDF